ncbi:MAG: AAA family ATPase, partial [Calditrichota bacterium]
MIKRRIEHKLIKALSRSSSVALLGPRQVGKTTLALSLGESTKAVYLDLENPQDLQKVGDIATFHKMNRDKLIILDEVQRLPEIFQQIRGIIDQERYRGNKTGIFLFLGSASIDLLKQSGESLAGRIAYHELFPIDLKEFIASGDKNNPMETLWLRGGFPESLLADTNANSIAWRHDFIRTYLERDIPQSCGM